MYGLYHFSSNSCVTCTLGRGCQCYFHPVYLDGQQHQPCDFHKCECLSVLFVSGVGYLDRQQHQLCECQSYYSPVSGIWKDSNTSCVSVKVTILQRLVSGKTATPAVLVSMLLFSSVWYLERQQHQLCEWQSYYSLVSGIWKDSNTSYVDVKVTILWYRERQQHQLC